MPIRDSNDTIVSSSGVEPAWRRKARAAQRLLRTLRPYNRRLVWLGLSSIASVVFEIIAIASIVPLATTISSGKESYEVPIVALDLSTWGLIGFTAGAVLLKLVFGFINATQDARLLARYELDHRRRGFRAFLRSTWDRQSGEGPGGLPHVLITVVSKSQAALRSLIASMNAATGLAIMLTGAFVAGGIGALLIVLAIVLLVILLAPVLARSRRHATRLLALGHQFTNDLEESTTLVREARVFGVQDRLIDRIDTSIVPYEHHRFRNQQLARVSALLFETAGLLLVIGSLGALYVVQPDSMEDLTVMALLMARGLMYGRQLNNQLQVCSDAVPAVISLEAAVTAYETDTPLTGSTEIDGIDSVEFDRVAYSYDSAADAVRGITVEIRRGDSVGIIGPSGSGKSTFLQLLLLLRSPTAGLVLVNGHDAADFSQDAWYDRVNLVSQDPRLVNGSILDNIRFFRSELSDEECIEAARRAHVHDEIVAMADGYATLVGPRGDAVSGGQRQRICIARALAGDPDLLVFDEPTSALDAHSEEAIHRTFEGLRGHTTLVIVAHRLSTVSICDKLMVFKGGVLEAAGPRREIEADGGYYAEVLRISQVV